VPARPTGVLTSLKKQPLAENAWQPRTMAETVASSVVGGLTVPFGNLATVVGAVEV